MWLDFIAVTLIQQNISEKGKHNAISETSESCIGRLSSWKIKKINKSFKATKGWQWSLITKIKEWRLINKRRQYHMILILSTVLVDRSRRCMKKTVKIQMCQMGLFETLTDFSQGIILYFLWILWIKDKDCWFNLQVKLSWENVERSLGDTIWIL